MLALDSRYRSSLTALSLITVLFVSPAFAGQSITNALAQEPVKIDFNDIVKDTETPSNSAANSTLRIAVAAMISPKYTYKYYLELLHLIGTRMGREVEFVQKKTYAEVNEMLKQKQLDLAFICSGPYVTGRKDFGLEIIAVPVCHGEKVYYSYFITAQESGLKSFEDLRGKTFAFTDPLSNSGYMVPVYYLARRGETPEGYFEKTFFTHSHDNAIQAVANGLADGAAVDSLIFEFMRVQNPELTARIRIIDKSPPYGNPPVVVPPSTDPTIKLMLKKIFLSVHEDPQGKKILENLRIDRFVEGNDADYDMVLKLQDFLKSKKRNK